MTGNRITPGSEKYYYAKINAVKNIGLFITKNKNII